MVVQTKLMCSTVEFSMFSVSHRLALFSPCGATGTTLHGGRGSRNSIVQHGVSRELAIHGSDWQDSNLRSPPSEGGGVAKLPYSQ